MQAILSPARGNVERLRSGRLATRVRDANLTGLQYIDMVIIVPVIGLFLYTHNGTRDRRTSPRALASNPLRPVVPPRVEPAGHGVDVHCDHPVRMLMDAVAKLI